MGDDGPSSQRRTKPSAELKGKAQADKVIANKKPLPRKPLPPPERAKPKEIK